MSTWNQLENELRSWTPRGPSPTLKSRIFGAPAVATAAETGSATLAERSFSWQWLAPSMALICLGLFLASQQHGMLPGLNPANSPSFLAATALKQPDLSTYYASARHSENNTPMAGLEWTNGSFALSTGPTNDLIH